MNERLVRQRRMEEQKLQGMFRQSSKLMLVPTAVLKAKKALRRDAMSQDLTITAQFVSSLSLDAHIFFAGLILCCRLQPVSLPADAAFLDKVCR